MINIKQKFTTKNKCYTNNTKIAVKGIILHSVGVPQPKADAFFNSFNSSTVSKAVHAFVQADGYVLQTLPWNIKAWHCGGSCNSTHIGVEMTEPSTIKYIGGATWTDLNPSQTAAFVQGTYKSAVELFAMLCKKYNLDPLQDGVILSHHEAHLRGKASNHGDVEHIWNKLGLTMNQFRKDVKKAMATAGTITTPTTTSTQQQTTGTTTTPVQQQTSGTGYFAQVKVQKNDTLNVRSTPNGSKVGTLANNYIVHVVEDKNGWSRLYSGGWVATRYLVKYNTKGFNYKPVNNVITVKADNLNIRSTPEVKNGNITGSVRKGQKFTIVGECSGYGLLLSGAGNISLDLMNISYDK